MLVNFPASVVIIVIILIVNWSATVDTIINFWPRQ
jgi:hypothetical protein